MYINKEINLRRMNKKSEKTDIKKNFFLFFLFFF